MLAYRPALVLGTMFEAAKAQTDPMGHVLLRNFSFPEGWTNLNQGSYGACPVEVRRAREAYRAEMDDSPEAFFRVGFGEQGRQPRAWELYKRARDALAEYLNVDPEDLVLVENASEGINAVLRSIARFLKPGKSMLYLDTAYGMVKTTLKYLGGRLPAEPAPATALPLLQVNITDLMPDISRQGIVDRVSAAIQQHAGEIGLCSFSHITSTPALILPVKDLIEACHSAGALVLIDGAHAPGSIWLDLSEIGADFYVGNGHKWLFSPQGSAFLHVRKASQQYIFPTVIDSPGDLTTRFIWEGTRDYSAMAAIYDALAWRERAGERRGDTLLIFHMRALAQRGGSLLAELWGTEQLPTDSLERVAMQASMANVRVPCGFLVHEPPCPKDLQQRVTAEAKSFVPIGRWAGNSGTWARISASIYSEDSDFELYGKAMLRVLQNASSPAVMV